MSSFERPERSVRATGALFMRIPRLLMPYVLYEAALSRPRVSCNGAELAGMERDRGKMFRFPGFVGSW